MPDPAEDFESPVPPITAPIPTPQPPLVTDAPGQSAPLTGRVVAMPDRNQFAQQQQDKGEAEYLRSVYSRSANFDQAQKDVSSARRMLGMMKADREIKAGVPVNEAMFHNMQYFTQPGQAGFAPTLKALQPAPRGRVMPASGGLPTGYLDPRGVPHWPSQSAMPKPEFKASVEEIAPGIKAAKLGPNHYQLLERPSITGSLDAVTKVQIDLWKADRKSAQAQLEQTSSKNLPRRAELQKQLDGLSEKIMGAAREGAGKSPAVKTDSNAGVLVKRKADGVQFRYKGDPKDVPADQYDVVQ